MQGSISAMSNVVDAHNSTEEPAWQKRKSPITMQHCINKAFTLRKVHRYDVEKETYPEPARLRVLDARVYFKCLLMWSYHTSLSYNLYGELCPLLYPRLLHPIS